MTANAERRTWAEFTAELLRSRPICQIGLPGCTVRATVVAKRTGLSEKPKSLTSCDRCAEGE